MGFHEGRGGYLKGRNVRAKDRSRGGCGSGSCPTRTEVGDGPDLWAPPVGVLGTRDPLVSGRSEVQGAAGCATWAGN